MRLAKVTGSFLAALLIHLIGVRIYPDFWLAVDIFLVVATFHALKGNLLAGMLAGFAAGMLSDGLTGGLYGQFGVVDTIVGYSASLAARRLVIQRAWSVAAVLSLAALMQQILLLVLQLLLAPLQALPGIGWVVIKVLSSGLLGITIFAAMKHYRRRAEIWRRNRTTKIRFGR